jgi:hypothetical protein
MRYPRIRPYKTYAVDDEGARARVDTHELVLERPAGIDLEVNLAPHPNFIGQVNFSTFRGSSLLLEAGGGNVLYLFVEDWPRGDRRRKDSRARKRGAPGHVYTVSAGGEKNPIEARRFAVELGSAEIEIDFTPPAPWADHVCVRSSGRPLVLRLNAANVVQVSVDAPAPRSRATKRDKS